MDSAPSTSQKAHNLFQVFLRLRPPQAGASPSAERFLTVEEPATDDAAPTHITLNPPNDRRRAIEKFAFTRVFEEDATQLDVFHCTGVVPLVEGVLAPHGGDGTDALLATLGVTGSGKSHTILGSRTQRGLTQLALDVVFRSLGHNIVGCASRPNLEASISASDPSEGAICSASAFIESVYADSSASSRPNSRAPTPMIVRSPHVASRFSLARGAPHHSPLNPCPRMGGSEGNLADLPGLSDSPKTVRQSNTMQGLHHDVPYQLLQHGMTPTRKQKQKNDSTMHFMAVTASVRQKKNNAKAYHDQGEFMGPPPTPSRRLLNRPSALPQQPDISALSVSCDPACEYAVVISMYEVYNDRIFDLLTPPIKSAATKEYRRRPLLFKPTEASPDRKVVAGLRKVVCGSLQQALMVLEAGLHERRVAGTGSNSVSSRSHGFICVEVKKRAKHTRNYPMESAWGGSTLTIVDLAGSERARDAKTAGATLAEAGKINESLMYLGQCLQMQSDSANKDKPGVVPFRQCKLTELLFSNSFPSVSSYSSSVTSRRNPQKAVMIVTADPLGDFNATSQILRYSALAREITVPRIPSITQTILSAAAAATTAHAPPSQGQCSSPVGSPPLYHRPFLPPGSSSGSAAGPNMQRTFSPGACSSGGDEHRSTMEHAALEIARLSEEVEYLRQALQSEQSARMEAEAHLLSMEDRMLELEQAIREDCTGEFERRLDIEMARWRANMQVEMERGEEHWGRKIEVFERTMGAGGDVDEDGENKENVLVEDMAEENDRLRRDNEVLRRELAGMSPTKRVPLRERPSDATAAAAATRAAVADTGSPRPGRAKTGAGDGGLHRKMERLRVSDDGDAVRNSSGGSPKKMRKLVAKRWDGALDEDDMF
ncbi:kinesin-like motor protein 9 [Phialemonium atrogriseum]|uniref:Kinesin-like protein n=1 Tax=Phialemonium atrogriseum TaxID=1093897 RepID=A0AAJ0FHW9_9PEZI|nr:kinesin-like motor protein 9 [Phialemonium atrogriseum]KAK1768177.1 kinesin-like motor protein 9 [Phialemonium atrogriseum]